MTSFLTDLALDAIAVHRLTRLATADEITQPARDWIIEGAYDRAHRRSYASMQQSAGVVDLGLPGGWQELVEHDENAPKLATLVTCRWCASIWIGFGVLVVRRRRWWRPVANVLGWSSVSTLLAGLER
jgi:hypothetical protein